MWTQEHELLASVVEVASVAATEKKLRRPVEIKRPAPPRASRVTKDKRAALARAQGAVSLSDAAISFGAAGRVRSKS